MSVRRLRVLSTVVLLCLLCGTGIFWLHEAHAHQVAVAAHQASADFAAPLDYTSAQQAIQEAQQEQASVRAEATAQLSAINPDLLPYTPTIYFAETGHHLSNSSGFLDYWRANGQKVTFGFPVTEEIVERGRIVQYFERARFEYQPATIDAAAHVQLGLLGQEMLNMQGRPAGIDDPENGALYFSETRHTLSGEFYTFWQRRGGLEAFGYPLSEPVEENGRLVQYFERAKMEYYPEDMGSFFRYEETRNGFNLNTLFEVRLADLGRQLATINRVKSAPVSQLPGTATWSAALFARHIEVDLSRQWLTAYEGDLLVYTAPVATGRDGFNTPVGDYAIYYRLPMQTMVGDAGGETWNVPNVPWVQYVVGGVALHGTYWHDAHGTGVRMSHGCVNLRMDDAQWLYEWADIGTTVNIHY